MEDGSKQCGSGQQRPRHPRPFFYVQRPSQPYFLYQPWQLNNPYGHYGVPAGFNVGRPCLYPYQYMQYPGFVFPHAPMYPIDCGRMFDPRFHAPGPAWNDAPRPPYPPPPPPAPPQPQSHREMSSSEAQTDPSDAISKLIECLDKIRGGSEQELDSGLASHSSGMLSPEEDKRSEESSPVLTPGVGGLECKPAALSDSTTAVYDADSSRRSLGSLGAQGSWLEEPPLDSSSVHDSSSERPAQLQKHFLSEENTETQDVQELQKLSLDPAPSPPTSSLKALKSEPSRSDHSFQVLRLPFHNILPSGDAAAANISSPSAPYYSYNYLSMHHATTTHERMSVLSPSLDELSSREEMFSTDLEEVDRLHIYGGHKLSEVIGGSPQTGKEVEEGWPPVSKRSICACCGKSLAKGGGKGKGKGHSSVTYREEGADSEEEEEEEAVEGRYGRGCGEQQQQQQQLRVVVRKHSAPRKLQPLPAKHAVKPRYRRGQYQEAAEAGNRDEAPEQDQAEAAEMTSAELQCRTCRDRPCREDVSVSERCRWGDADLMPRRRPGVPQQKQEMSTQRKMMYHRSRDEDQDEDDPLPLHWERGSTVRGEPRC